ncbi:MAG: hypothetical protein GF353_02530 [Candidatus Lokiarchaeota archaeon]|nr:hypothetical protein [Candidatus Lokiarchaeota archaeon]
MSEINGNRFIFIGGAPRSGTTLLHNMLDSHPEIYGGPEFLHLKDIIDLRRKLYGSIEKEWIDVFCTYEEADAHLRTLVENMLLPLADRKNLKYISEKTPENILVFSELLNLFPDAHFIHIIRDPRAIVSSLLQVRNRAIAKGMKPPGITANIQTAIRHTKNCIVAGLQAAKAAPDRIHTVVYEQLVREPETESKALCDFLNIEWHENMLFPGKQKHDGEKAITEKSGQIWYDKKTYYSNPDTNKLDQWKTNLSARKQLTVSLAFKSLKNQLMQYGYDLSPDSFNFGKRVEGIAYNYVTHFNFLVFQGLRFYQTKFAKH